MKFARDRDVYREWLRGAVKRYGVPVYGYCLTSNHVYLVVHVDDAQRVGLMMHLAAGAFVQHLNRRKGFEGSVYTEASIAADLSTWTIREESLPYGSFSGAK